MPSPVGHALGGAIFGLLLGPASPAGVDAAPARRIAAACRRPAVRLAALAGMAPDADFLWGRHNMETHSLGAALAAALVVGLVASHARARLAAVAGLAWATHVLFDWLGSDDTPPLGVMALWPVSSGFYFAHAYVFDAISRRYWLPGFVWHNLRALITECLWLVPPSVLLALWTGRRGASDIK